MAAILNGDKSKDLEEMLVLDAIPHALGVETVGGVMTPVLRRNTTLPTRHTETFTTSADNQPLAVIDVYEGHRPLTKDNHLLCKLVLTHITPAAKGVPQIQVIFDMNSKGILSVTAEDKSTGRLSKVIITDPALHTRVGGVDMVWDSKEYPIALCPKIVDNNDPD